MTDIQGQCSIHSELHTSINISLHFYFNAVQNDIIMTLPPPPHHNRFTAFFPGPPGWAGGSRELLNFMVQGQINRGRHTDHSTGRHSVRTSQCLPPPSPILFLQARCPSCHPTNNVKAVKANNYDITDKNIWDNKTISNIYIMHSGYRRLHTFHKQYTIYT